VGISVALEIRSESAAAELLKNNLPQVARDDTMPSTRSHRIRAEINLAMTDAHG
jgi:hypothetical protein